MTEGSKSYNSKSFRVIFNVILTDPNIFGGLDVKFGVMDELRFVTREKVSASILRRLENTHKVTPLEYFYHKKKKENSNPCTVFVTSPCDELLTL